MTQFSPRPPHEFVQYLSTKDIPYMSLPLTHGAETLHADARFQLVHGALGGMRHFSLHDAATASKYNVYVRICSPQITDEKLRRVLVEAFLGLFSRGHFSVDISI